MKLRGLSALDVLALMVFWGQIQNVFIQSSVEMVVPYMLLHDDVALPDAAEDSSGSNETLTISAVASNATSARLNFDGFRCKEKERTDDRPTATALKFNHGLFHLNKSAHIAG